MNSRRSRVPDWLRLYGPLALVLGAPWWLFAWQESRVLHAQLLATQWQAMDAASQRLAEPMNAAVADLRWLAQSTGVTAAVANPQAEPAVAAREFSALATLKPQYTRLRLLDAQGNERLRVDGPAVAGSTHVAASDELDSAAGRDFFKRARPLPLGTVYVSRIELQVDRGQLVLPFRPTLRYATPLRHDGGDAQVLALNQDADVLLHDLVATLAGPGLEPMLLDREGYWLYHPDEALRWGAQRADGISLARRNPEVWRHMEQDQGEIVDRGSLYLYRRLYPLRGSTATAEELVGELSESGLWLVQRLTPQALAAQRVSYFAWPWWLLQAIALGLALLQSRARHAALRRRDEREQERRQLDVEHDDLQWARARVYETSLAVQQTQDAESFAQQAVTQLAQHLPLSIGAFYRLQGGWLRALAGFGLAEGVYIRQFKLGEGLVGEAVKERREVHLTELPPAYLEVRSALGSSTPRELLVVPLWLRDRNLGALELGLNAPLSPRQRLMLDQLLPLLALHLGNFSQRN